MNSMNKIANRRSVWVRANAIAIYPSIHWHIQSNTCSRIEEMRINKCVRVDIIRLLLTTQSLDRRRLVHCLAKCSRPKSIAIHIQSRISNSVTTQSTTWCVCVIFAAMNFNALPMTPPSSHSRKMFLLSIAHKANTFTRLNLRFDVSSLRLGSCDKNKKARGRERERVQHLCVEHAVCNSHVCRFTSFTLNEISMADDMRKSIETFLFIKGTSLRWTDNCKSIRNQKKTFR